MQIRNTNPYGHVDVPLLGRQGEPYDEPGVGCVSAGEELDVTEDQARRLLPQLDNWAPVDDEARELAAELANDLADDVADALGMPATSDLKSAWVAYARLHGDPDPDAKTKQQLIDAYGLTAEAHQDEDEGDLS